MALLIISLQIDPSICHLFPQPFQDSCLMPACEIWKVVHKKYSALNYTCIEEIKDRLRHLMLTNDTNIDAYVKEFISARIMLLATGEDISDIELACLFLRGLPSMFVYAPIHNKYFVIMNNRLHEVSFENLHTHATTIAIEAHLECQQDCCPIFIGNSSATSNN